MTTDALRVGIGWSARHDAAAAAKESASSAQAMLGSSAQKLALVFASSGFDHAALLQHLSKALGRCPMVGGSGAGLIVPDGPMPQGCLVMLLSASVLVGFAILPMVVITAFIGFVALKFRRNVRIDDSLAFVPIPIPPSIPAQPGKAAAVKSSAA